MSSSFLRLVMATSLSASKPNFHPGMREEDLGVGDGVADNDQAIAAAELERDMARGVAGRVQDSDAACHFAAGLEKAHPVLEGRELGLAVGDHGLHFLGHLGRQVLGGPEIPFGFSEMMRRVGIHLLAVGAD